MPQKKRAIRISGIAKALLFHPEVGKFASKRPGAFRGNPEYTALVKVAENPRSITFPSSNLLNQFVHIFARQPDDVIEFLRIARGILKKWDTTQAGTVMKYFCQHRSIQIDKRREECDKDGKCIAVVITSFLDDREKRIPITRPHPEKLNELLTPNFALCENLLDKEIAILLKVSTESVKKARQELAKISRELSYWEHPAVIKFMQNGLHTEEYGRVWSEYAKGKK